MPMLNSKRVEFNWNCQFELRQIKDAPGMVGVGQFYPVGSSSYKTNAA